MLSFNFVRRCNVNAANRCSDRRNSQQQYWRWKWKPLSRFEQQHCISRTWFRLSVILSFPYFFDTIAFYSEFLCFLNVCGVFFTCSGDYMQQHSNESSPTSPSVGGGSVNELENSTLAPSTCDSNRDTQVDTSTAAPATATGDTDGTKSNKWIKWLRATAISFKFKAYFNQINRRSSVNTIPVWFFKKKSFIYCQIQFKKKGEKYTMMFLVLKLRFVLDKLSKVVLIQKK